MRGLDLKGKTFGRLTAVKRIGTTTYKHPLWLWKCSCGKKIERPSGHIVRGNQVSCGCHRDEQSRLRVTHGKSSTRTYKAWIAMKARVRGSDDRNKKYYTERNIVVCNRWKNSFENFLKDMGECPPRKTLDRKDSNGNYEPNNCKWSTQAEQIRNTRRTVRVVVNGTTMCLKDACFLLEIPYARVRSRVRFQGLTPQEALDRK